MAISKVLKVSLGCAVVATAAWFIAGMLSDIVNEKHLTTRTPY
jgi:hypothetical protein